MMFGLTSNVLKALAALTATVSAKESHRTVVEVSNSRSIVNADKNKILILAPAQTLDLELDSVTGLASGDTIIVYTGATGEIAQLGGLTINGTFSQYPEAMSAANSMVEIIHLPAANSYSIAITPKTGIQLTSNLETSALDTSPTKYPSSGVVKAAVDAKVSTTDATYSKIASVDISAGSATVDLGADISSYSQVLLRFTAVKSSNTTDEMRLQVKQNGNWTTSGYQGYNIRYTLPTPSGSFITSSAGCFLGKDTVSGGLAISAPNTTAPLWAESSLMEKGFARCGGSGVIPTGYAITGLRLVMSASATFASGRVEIFAK